MLLIIFNRGGAAGLPQIANHGYVIEESSRLQVVMGKCREQIVQTLPRLQIVQGKPREQIIRQPPANKPGRVITNKERR